MKMNQPFLIGPFTQVVTMDKLPHNGHISDEQLEIIKDGGVMVENGRIMLTGSYAELKKMATEKRYEILEQHDDTVLLPGFIDSHTHICFSGSRCNDYALRLQGKTYLEIAKSGGGIMETVRKTRKASLEELIGSLTDRCTMLLSEGVTTCEVKSGYGLTASDELKMLHAIKQVNTRHAIDLVSTCLAAHICPPEFKSCDAYIKHVNEELLPFVMRLALAKRADIYIEDTAFGEEEATMYIEQAKKLGFSIVVHADQFSVLGSSVAARYNAVSADHLEVTSVADMEMLAENNVIGIVLPGSSVGLGLPYAKASKMLDAGMCVAIASDWNPGTSPMGDLLLLASLLGVYEKLSIAETLAGITVRAANALEFTDRGKLAPGMQADMISFPCHDYREIIYRQGKLKPLHVWKNGERVK
jgi:imidazolonepropionase